MEKRRSSQLSWGDHAVVVGVQQTGKSTLARELAGAHRRVIVFDPKGDYSTRLRGARVLAPVELEDPEPWDRPRFRLVVLAGRGQAEVADEFRYVVRRVREEVAAHHYLIVLVADEAVLYGAQCAQTLRALFANGHGTAPGEGGIITIFVAQRAVDLPLGCRALATRAYGFRQTHATDLERLADEFGEDFAEDSRTWRAGEPPAYWEQERFYSQA